MGGKNGIVLPTLHKLSHDILENRESLEEPIC